MPVTPTWTMRPLYQGSGIHGNSSVFNFTRNVPTVDPLGAQVAANTPRFGPSQGFAGLTQQSPQTVNLGSNSINDGFDTSCHVGLDAPSRAPISVCN